MDWISFFAGFGFAILASALTVAWCCFVVSPLEFDPDDEAAVERFREARDQRHAEWRKGLDSAAIKREAWDK